MKNNKVKDDPRYLQTTKETLTVFILLIVNIIWWFAFAYGLGSKSPDEYSYVLGFPAWFFWSCIVSLFVFSILVVLVVSFVFKDIPLDPLDKEMLGGDDK
ncbi:YhdT family protein [Thermovenabulum sp.]|uniref:YhdT family protein n=1 Tax=Thermovenabulum sp. TaxID=3100335 RepID=UPI003C7C5710